MVVGLTGGIGSGKTLVSTYFKSLGVPIYITDDEAKRIMHSEPEIIQSIKNLLGDLAYQNNVLNRKFIASQVFNNKEKLNQLNAIVHPVVAKDFKIWYAKQIADFVIKESAILFETNSAQYCDVTILVTAPLEVRINRVVNRDKVSQIEVKQRIDNQWKDQVKISLADYVIHNINKKETFDQVLKLHSTLKDKALSC